MRNGEAAPGGTEPVSAGKFPFIREIIGNFANRMRCGLFAGVKTDYVSVG